MLPGTPKLGPLFPYAKSARDLPSEAIHSMSNVVETHTDIVPRLEAAAERVQRAHKAAAAVIFGQDQVIERTLITILSGGHALLIGVPGLAYNIFIGAIILGMMTLHSWLERRHQSGS